MSRYILVPATGTGSRDAVFRTAPALARLSAGHLGFLHVQPSVDEAAAFMSAGDVGETGAGIRHVLRSAGLPVLMAH